ncbi:MAG: hypothetical protein ACYSWQ_00640 [Planctomycetota bacterium]|jgi:hypothetical protein
MNNDEILELWQEARSQLEISQGFSDGVMNRIFECESRRSRAVFDLCRLIEVISSSPAATAAVMALGAAAGITRIAIVVLSFLAF